jgi:hypothetical protein
VRGQYPVGMVGGPRIVSTATAVMRVPSGIRCVPSQQPPLAHAVKDLDAVGKLDTHPVLPLIVTAGKDSLGPSPYFIFVSVCHSARSDMHLESQALAFHEEPEHPPVPDQAESQLRRNSLCESFA